MAEGRLEPLALAVRVLGDLDVTVAGQPVELGGPLPRRLFTHLALHRNTAVPLDEIVDLLWPEDPPHSAEKTTQVYVSRVRRQLGPARERLTSSATGYRLALADDEFDLARAEAIADSAEHHLDQGEVGEAEQAATTALALWRGPALADLHDQAFLGYKARVEELQMRLLHSMLDAQMLGGSPDAAIARLEQAVREHPIRERLWVQLMYAQYAASRQGDALHTFLRARTVLDEELGTEPGPELVSAQRRILDHAPLPRSSAASHLATEAGLHVTHGARVPEIRLPTLLDDLVGRGAAIREVDELVGQHRLVTLVGTGGVGKTRLAIEAGHRMASRFDGGVTFVDLTALREPGLVIDTITQEMDPGAGGDAPPMQRLLDLIGTRETLLILDNFEQLLDAAAGVADLLRRAPSLRVLVTSRAALRVRGEFAYRVDVLGASQTDAPGALGDADTNPALVLFARRARAARGRVVGPDDIEVASAICARLDGLPLAIELAATRSRGMGLADLLDQLERRLPVLTDGPRDLPDRHQTLGAAIDWSLELLPPDARSVFAHLATFAGTFDLAAAIAVSEFDDEGQIVRAVSSLVEHSLVLRAEDRPGRQRYRLLQTVREAASGHLGSDEAAATQGRALRHWRSESAAAGVPAVPGDQAVHGDQAAWIRRTTDDLDNIRAALLGVTAASPVDWVDDAVLTICNLRRFWDFTGRSREARERLMRLLDLAGDRLPPATRGLALNHIGTTYLAVGEHRAAEPYLREALELRQLAGSPAEISATLSNLALVRRFEGDLVAMRGLMVEALELSRQADDRWGVAAGLGNLGVAALEAADLDEATQWFQQAQAGFEALGDRASVAMVLDSLGAIAMALSDFGTAADLLGQSRRIALDLGDEQSLPASGINLARLWIKSGLYPEARAMALETAVLVQQRHEGFHAVEVLELLAHLAEAEGRDREAATLLGVAQARRDHEGWAIQPNDRAAWRDQTVRHLGERLGEAELVRVQADAATLDPDTILAAQVARLAASSPTSRPAT